MELWPHQQKAFDFVKSRDYYGLFWEMRVGKTYPMIKIIEHIRSLMDDGHKKALILMPPSAMADWKDAMLKMSPLQTMELYAGGKDQFRLWNESERGILLFTYSHVNNESLKGRYVTHHEVKDIDIICCDESHKIKNSDTGNCKFALGLSKRAKKRFILTGTPTGGNFVDYYTQLKFLDPNILDGFTKTQFLRGYFSQGFNGKWTMRDDCLEVFYGKLREHTSSLRLKDVAKCMPQIRNIKVNIEPGEEMLERCEKLKRDFILSHKDKEVSAVNAGAEIIKLMQIVNGHCKDDEGNIIQFEESNKIQWLRDNMKQIVEKDKVVMWCIFQRDHHNVRRCLDELEIPYVHYKSGATQKMREKRLRAFRENPHKRVFIAHQDSAGTGVNLSTSDVVVNYSRNYDWLAFQQSQSRNISLGERKITIYDLVVNKTIDEIVYNALQKKGEVAAKS